jgi:manganese transport protein
MARDDARVAAIPEVIERRGDAKMIRAARASMAGKSSGMARLLPFLGPAFIASVAYMDPGNFATNIQGGAQFGYQLLWVVTASSVMAAFLQTLSAKLGIATDANLPDLCRRHFSRTTNIALWVVSEIAAMATDVAEFTGAALGLTMLAHLPLFASALVTGVFTFWLLSLQRHGMRGIEIVIAGMVGIIAITYIVETILARPNAGQVIQHSLIPSFAPGTLFLSVGILGATVMPHVLYLHSALVERRVPARSVAERKRLFGMERLDIIIAMTLAAFINLAMMFMAAAAFHSHGLTHIVDLTQAYRTLTPLLGGAAGLVFGISLLVSGLSSSTVGTMAGQVIMQGFLGWSIPVWVRRIVTMLPALVIIAIGLNPTEVITLTQVILSFALVAPIGTLLYFTSRREVMGALVNRRSTMLLGIAIGGAIVLLNIVLLAQIAGIVH